MANQRRAGKDGSFLLRGMCILSSKKAWLICGELGLGAEMLR